MSTWFRLCWCHSHNGGFVCEKKANVLCKLTTNTVMLLTPTESHKLPVLLLSRASLTGAYLLLVSLFRWQFWDHTIHTIVKHVCSYLHRKELNTQQRGTFAVKGFMATNLFSIVTVLGLQYSHSCTFGVCFI